MRVPKAYYEQDIELLEHRHDWIDCAECGARMNLVGLPPSVRGWCSPRCSEAWHNDHPEEAAKWIAVGDLTRAQRAELDAILGHVAGHA
jgi:uncharacterized paraquat-inducible protein A